MVEHTQTHSPAFFRFESISPITFNVKSPKSFPEEKYVFPSSMSNESLHVSLPGLQTQEQNSVLRLQNDDTFSIYW